MLRTAAADGRADGAVGSGCQEDPAQGCASRPAPSQAPRSESSFRDDLVTSGGSDAPTAGCPGVCDSGIKPSQAPGSIF